MKTLSLLFSAIALSSLILYSGCSGNEEPSGPDCTMIAVAVPLANITTPTSCSSNDGQLTAVATGGIEPYQYKLGSGTYQSSAVFSNLSPGTYLVSTKDSKGCEAISSNVIIANIVSTLAATAEVSADTECSSGNGIITVTASGGTEPYQYKLGSGSFGSVFTFSNLESGTYSVTVKDAENCSIAISKVVSRGSTGTVYDGVGGVKEIFIAKCQFTGCHPTNGDWFTYLGAKNKASTIKAKTTSGEMPKGGTSAPGGALTAEQIKLIACWVDDGAPEN